MPPNKKWYTMLIFSKNCPQKITFFFYWFFISSDFGLHVSHAVYAVTTFARPHNYFSSFDISPDKWSKIWMPQNQTPGYQVESVEIWTKIFESKEDKGFVLPTFFSNNVSCLITWKFERKKLTFYPVNNLAWKSL